MYIIHFCNTWDILKKRSATFYTKENVEFVVFITQVSDLSGFSLGALIKASKN